MDSKIAKADAKHQKLHSEKRKKDKEQQQRDAAQVHALQPLRAAHRQNGVEANLADRKSVV